MAEDQLEPLITECPNCSTRFRVTENQLQVATGKVRCGACLTVFHGIDHLVWESGPGFDSAEQAKHALDELLNELSHEDLMPDETSAQPTPRERELATQESELEPSATEEKEPSAEPSADKEPSATEEPSATKEPSADKEPSATEDKEPSATEDKEPSATNEQQPPAEDEESAPTANDTSPLQADPLEAWDAEVAQVFVGHEGEPEQPEEAEPAADLDSDSTADVADLEVLADDSAGGVPQAEQFADTSPPAEPLNTEAELTEDAVSEVTEEAEVVEEPHFGVPPDQATSLDDEREPQPIVAVDPLGLEQTGVSEVSFAPEPRRWWVGIAMGLGVLALLGQIFWYQFESWGRDPTLRPVYGFICGTLGCELPVLRELSALRTQKLLVRSHPELADALVVDAVIVNGADFAQPFPELELRFTTIDGNLVAGRRFKPEEYLAGELAGVTLMAPKTPVRLALEIADPGGDAVNYFLSFR